MAVESAADRAAMFADWGTAAQYQPPGLGAAVDCTVVYSPDRSGGLPFEAAGGEDAALVTELAYSSAQILVDEVGLVEQSGTLTLGELVDEVFVPGDSFTIVGRPSRDETGEIWTVDLEPQP